MDATVNYKIIRGFGPSVLKVTIPENLIIILNNYIDDVIKNKNKSKKLDHGKSLVGDVTQEFHLDKETIENTGWARFLGNCVNRWVEIETGKKISKFHIKSSWIVRQFKNEYNPTHWHTAHISGAGYLKLPDNLGEYTQKEKDSKNYKGGNLQLIHGSRMFLCQSTLDIVPKVGDFYFFPNYMMHTVFPFKGSDQERRSISFNAEIDSEIYNVYGK